MNNLAVGRGAASSLARIGGFTAACVLVSNVIGSGIFTTTGFMARDLGDPWLILGLWGIGGLLALTGAMSYGELGAAFPRAGGDYVYVRETYGPCVGFLNGWTSFTMGFSAPIAAAAVSFTAYFLQLLPWQALPGIDPFGLTPMLLPVVLVWSLTAFHLAGVAAGGSLQRLLTATTVLAMLFLVGGAFTLGQGTWAHFTETPGTAPPRVGTMVVSLIFVMYTYSGWNVAGYIAGEIRDPGRTIPRTMIAGTLFVTVLYLALNAVYLYALPVGALAQEPILPVAEKAAVAMFGAEEARLVAALLCCSIAAAVSAMIWAGPRVYFAMARDGLLPSLFGRTGPRSGAPVYAILLQSGWATVLILSGTFEQLVIYSGFILTLFSGLAVAAVPILRWRRADLPRPYRAPGYPIVPGLFILAALVIVTYTVWERPTEAGWALATLAAGYPLYLWSRRRTRDKAQDPEQGRGTQG